MILTAVVFYGCSKEVPIVSYFSLAVTTFQLELYIQIQLKGRAIRKCCFIY